MTAAAASAATVPANTLPSKLLIDRKEFEDTCARRFLYGPSGEPYGGTAGLFDFGPVMCAMKANFLQLWRTHFVVEEQMCEIDTPCVTPQEILKASGHEERFNDTMVRDTVTGECIRLDKYVTEWLEAKAADPKTPKDDKAHLMHQSHMIEAMKPEEVYQLVQDQGIKSKVGNTLSEPFPFNLMFPTVIGPEGDKRAYMRPELAQGIFLNFKRLVDTGCAQKMPFAGACIGQAFRNEIAPRNALLRVREFTLAEIEHFMNPDDKSHAKFARVKDVKIWAWNRNQQEAEPEQEPTLATVGELVEKKIIDNETIGYFIARTQIFLDKVGAKTIRFRQHMKTEMAHYAQDCWDAELLTSFGWCECVGLADRSAYDLDHHMKACKKNLTMREQYAQPRVDRVLVRELNKKVAAKTLGKDMGAFDQFLQRMTECEAKEFAKALKEKGPQQAALPNGNTVTINPDFATIEERDIKRTGRDYTPSVVEPSFGVGRILYAILEQSYYVRRDESGKNDKRAVFSLMANLASQKVAVLPLMNKPQLEQAASALVHDLLAKGVPCRTDDSGSAIGKKYARTDEIGIPYAVTVDFGAVEDGTVTLRERDTTEQVRVPVTEVVDVVQALSRLENPLPWKDVVAKYPAQAASPTAAPAAASS